MKMVNLVVAYSALEAPYAIAPANSIRRLIAENSRRRATAAAAELATSTLPSPIRSPMTPPGNCPSAYAPQTAVITEPASVRFMSNVSRKNGTSEG